MEALYIYSPPTENDTEGYIKMLGFDADTKITEKNLPVIFYEIVKVETGQYLHKQYIFKVYDKL